MRARVLTALAGIIVVLPIVWIGSWLFGAVTLLVAGIALTELEQAGRAGGRRLHLPLAGLVSGLVIAGATLAPPGQSGWLGWMLALLPILTALSAVVEYSRPGRRTLADYHLTQAAALYIGLFAFFPLLRNLPGGLGLFWLVLLGVWAADILAFFGGRLLGRHAMTPLSPSKTWEGWATGWAGCWIICGLSAPLLGINGSHGLALGLLIGIIAPVGDLAASYWKRETGIKDFGRLLPGHGGVLDRVDSLLFAVPVVYWYACWQQLGR